MEIGDMVSFNDGTKIGTIINILDDWCEIEYYNNVHGTVTCRLQMQYVKKL